MTRSDSTPPAWAQSRPSTLEVQAAISGTVPVATFCTALAHAGLVCRYEADRGALVIEPAEAPHGLATAEDARVGICWYNGLSRCERAHWHEVADSAAPADCLRAFQNFVA